eukprot:9491472-Pyramimonas_sp.AAC.1
MPVTPTPTGPESRPDDSPGPHLGRLQGGCPGRGAAPATASSPRSPMCTSNSPPRELRESKSTSAASPMAALWL